MAPFDFACPERRGHIVAPKSKDSGRNGIFPVFPNRDRSFSPRPGPGPGPRPARSRGLGRSRSPRPGPGPGPRSRGLASESQPRYPVRMPFSQEPPRLGNTYEGDPLLREHLARTFPPGDLAGIEPELVDLGALAGGPLFEQQLAERDLEPTLAPWDPWGRRVDRIRLTPLWREAAALAARHGLVATAYERRHGARSRTHQLALAYVLDPSTDVYSCPLAMTDGAAPHLAGSRARVDERAVDDRADRRVGRVRHRDGRAARPRRHLPPPRHEVVQLGDDRRGGARARATGGEPRRLA